MKSVFGVINADFAAYQTLEGADDDARRLMGLTHAVDDALWIVEIKRVRRITRKVTLVTSETDL